MNTTIGICATVLVVAVAFWLRGPVPPPPKN